MCCAAAEALAVTYALLGEWDEGRVILECHAYGDSDRVPPTTACSTPPPTGTCPACEPERPHGSSSSSSTPSRRPPTRKAGTAPKCARRPDNAEQ